MGSENCFFSKKTIIIIVQGSFFEKQNEKKKQIVLWDRKNFATLFRHQRASPIEYKAENYTFREENRMLYNLRHSMGSENLILKIKKKFVRTKKTTYFWKKKDTKTPRSS